MTYRFIFIFSILLSGCSIGHQAFVEAGDNLVGKKLHQPYKKNKNAGTLIRSSYLIQGTGFRYKTKDKQGNTTFHYFASEVLPNYSKKKWVGKCLYFIVVDSDTNLVKSWGFDKEGNPFSCRTWP